MDILRIFIAEDHETVREGLKLIINQQEDMEVCGEAGDGRAAVKMALELNPDIVLMDVTMPDLNGLKATKKLKELKPQIKILTVTRHSDDGYLQELLRAGASGYILKQSPSTELLRGIRAIARGGNYLDPAIAGRVIGNFTRRAADSEKSIHKSISERETKVLRQIAWGYSNKEIAAQMSISVKTVEAHKSNAMRKLDMGSRIDIVRFAILQGWLVEN